jgi:hypothetical protein
VKNKRDTNLQCPYKAIFGCDVCGKHAKAKNIRRWKDLCVLDMRVVRCQAIARGWSVRRHLRIAGPGVLRRGIVANDEDVISYNDKNRIHPFNYFAFEESSKIWCFEFGSIWSWMSRSAEPVNPYTKVPLSLDVRRRLRELWYIRSIKRLAPLVETSTLEERIEQRWTILCQIFSENGFVDATPDQFIQLPRSAYVAVFRMVFHDLGNHHKTEQALCMGMLSPMIMEKNNPIYIINALRVLLRILLTQREPYNTVFVVMSALFRC